MESVMNRVIGQMWSMVNSSTPQYVTDFWSSGVSIWPLRMLFSANQYGGEGTELEAGQWSRGEKNTLLYHLHLHTSTTGGAADKMLPSSQLIAFHWTQWMGRQNPWLMNNGKKNWTSKKASEMITPFAIKSLACALVFPVAPSGKKSYSSLRPFPQL